MHSIFNFAAAVALVSIATPAYADKFFAVTPSGATETLFSEKPEAVVGKLSSKCMDLSWSVVSSSSSSVVCESPLNTGQAMIGQLLMGNSYSTPPKRFFRFNIGQLNGISRVQAAGWMELQMAFGQTKRTDFSGPEFHNGMMNFMGAAGGKPPVGTTFPNHALLGFDSETISHGKYRVPRITKLHPGQPAEKAGLRVGDIVTKVAGERIKNDDDWMDAAARAAKAPTYQVVFIRDGSETKATLERAFRPTWSEAVVAANETTSIGAPSSNSTVADELAKLARLRDDGTLTEAEFQAQKLKLLEQ